MEKYPHGLTLNAVCAALEDYQHYEDTLPEKGILAAFNTLLGHSDIAEEFRALEQKLNDQLGVNAQIVKIQQKLIADIGAMVQRAEAAEAKLAAAIPEGCQLVPVEPTEGMVIAGFESEPDESFSTDEEWEAYEAMSGCQQAAHRAKLCYAAMLAAAPKPFTD